MCHIDVTIPKILTFSFKCFQRVWISYSTQLKSSQSWTPSFVFFPKGGRAHHSLIKVWVNQNTMMCQYKKSFTRIAELLNIGSQLCVVSKRGKALPLTDQSAGESEKQKLPVCTLVFFIRVLQMLLLIEKTNIVEEAVSVGIHYIFLCAHNYPVGRHKMSALEPWP